jgi:hypothetical protein
VLHFGGILRTYCDEKGVELNPAAGRTRESEGILGVEDLCSRFVDLACTNNMLAYGLRGEG